MINQQYQIRQIRLNYITVLPCCLCSDFSLTEFVFVHISFDRYLLSYQQHQWPRDMQYLMLLIPGQQLFISPVKKNSICSPIGNFQILAYLAGKIQSLGTLLKHLEQRQYLNQHKQSDAPTCHLVIQPVKVQSTTIKYYQWEHQPTGSGKQYNW